MQTATSLEPTDGPLTVEELQLATRNRGMPLEAMAYDLTPTGLHYLLIHFDIPVIDPTSWRLTVGGRARRPMSLTLADIQARPRQTLAVTMECAGNGRARLSPRPLSQPWLVEAIGTAEWTGTPLAGVLADAELHDDATELVFTGADRGVQGGQEHDYARSLSVVEATRPEVLLAYEMNGRPIEPQHGFPLRLVVPGWYGMTSVKWLTSIEAVDAPFGGYQQAGTYLFKTSADDPGTPVKRIVPRALMIPPGIPEFFNRRRVVDAGSVQVSGRAWSGESPIVAGGIGGARARAPPPPPPPGPAVARGGWWRPWGAAAG